MKLVEFQDAFQCRPLRFVSADQPVRLGKVHPKSGGIGIAYRGCREMLDGLGRVPGFERPQTEDVELVRVGHRLNWRVSARRVKPLAIDADTNFRNSADMAFALNPDLDPAMIAAELASTGRVQICDFLELAGAEALLRFLLEAGGWRHVVNAGDNVYEIGCDELERMNEEQRRTLDRKTDEQAAEGFQFRFDTIRVPDDELDRASQATILTQFASFLSSPDTVEWFRRITGRQAIDFADAQATRYRNGAYLTRHDDAVEGKQRHFAYVMNLTKDWRAEWGGLLFFPTYREIRIDALVPEFNVLHLFEVGQQHGVTQVASYAPRPRISVTGWLRSRG